MANKLQLAALMLGAALCFSTAIAKPPPGSVTTYVPPATTQTDTTTTQGAAGQGVATPNTTSNAPPPAANPDLARQLTPRQARAMRACIRNCLAAGMTGTFCSHSCIPD